MPGPLLNAVPHFHPFCLQNVLSPSLASQQSLTGFQTCRGGSTSPAAQREKSEEARKGVILCLQAGVPCPSTLSSDQGTGTVARRQIVGACVHVTRTVSAAGILKGNCRIFSKPDSHSPATGHGAGHLGGPKPRCSALTTAVSLRGCSLRTATPPCLGRGGGVWNRCVTTPPLTLHVTRSSLFDPVCSFWKPVTAAKNSSPHGQGRRRMWSGAGLCGSNPNRAGFASARGGEMHVYQFFVSLVT